MKPLILVPATLVAFGLGWLGHAYFRPATTPAAASPVSAAPAGTPSAYATQLQGRFVLDSAECAGFEFTGGPYAIWRNELSCEYPDTFYIHWLTSNTFLAKEKNRLDSTSSPQVWLTTVEEYDGQQLRLRDLWTGWGPYKESTTQLRRLEPGAE